MTIYEVGTHDGQAYIAMEFACGCSPLGSSTAHPPVLHATGVYPPFGRPMADSLFVLAAAYRAVFGVLGCLVAGLLAPARPQAHAMALGALGVVLGALGAAATWNAGPEFGPRWYALSLVALALPCAWLGGRMAERRRAQAR